MVAYRVTCSGELWGVERWANVFTVDAVEPVNLSGIEAAFQNFYDPFGTPNGVLLHSTGNAYGGVIGVKLTKISIQRRITPTVPVETILSMNAGQSAPKSLPADVATVITWRTANAGRSYRGRTYLPPWNVNRLDDSGGQMPRALASAVTAAAAAAGQLIVNLAAADAPLAIWSRTLPHAPGTPGSVAALVTGGYVDDEWDTQRRRSKSQPRARTVF